MNAANRLGRYFLMMVVLVAGGAVYAQDAPDSAAQPNPAPQSNGQSIQPAQDTSELVSEIEQLRGEVDRLKQQVAALNQIVEQLQSEETPATAPKSATKSPAKPTKKKLTDVVTTPTPPPTPQPDERTAKTVLVFHDGHKVEATNYAIVGQTLWIYTDSDSKKVPLADLDVTATKNANSDRGITFQVPPTK